MRHKALVWLCAVAALLGGCSNENVRARAVYMLMDTSGTYTAELNKAQAIINYLLGTLGSGDSLAVARIDSGSFSEKDIVGKVTFDPRPSRANEQKRNFKEMMDGFASTVSSSPYTDITGGALQAVQFLRETGAGQQYILVFSDLKEDLQKGHVRDFPLDFRGVKVIAVNVTKLRSDNIDPREYMTRLEEWQARVQSGGGGWKIVNDLDNLDRLLEE